MIVVGFVLIAVAAAAIFITMRFEGVFRDQVEARISESLGVAAGIDHIRLAPARLGIELRGVRLKNPPEFKEDQAIECERILIQPDLRTVFSETIAINEIILNGLRINLRYRPGEGTNLGQISRQAAQHAEPASGAKAPRRRVLVKEVKSSGGTFEARSNLSLGVPVSLHIEPFAIKSVGGGQPVSPAKLTSIVLRSLVMEAVTLKGLLRPVVELLRKEVQ